VPDQKLPVTEFDASRPHVARVYDYLLAQFRTYAQIVELFDGLELVEPGLVLVPDWRPCPGTPGVRDHPVLQMACPGVARKP
jgi:S-adenosyl methyltransferase